MEAFLQVRGLCHTGTRSRTVAVTLVALLFFLAQTTSPQAVADDNKNGRTTESDEPAVDPSAADTAEFTTERIHGKVVWLSDALERRFGIETDYDARHAMVALNSPEDGVFPIAKDARGRGFHLDERLRDIELELLVRRYPASPVAQVIRVYRVRPDGLYELDYWCDICAIPMYELKPCECCQGETRIRERAVVDGVTMPQREPAP